MDHKFVIFLVVFGQISPIVPLKCTFDSGNQSALCKNIERDSDLANEIRPNWQRVTIQNRGDGSFTLTGRNNIFRKVQELNLAHSGYLFIPTGFRGLDQLTLLNLSNTSVKALSNNWFNPTNTLKHLDLSHNELRLLKRDHFRVLKNLRTINFWDNYIDSIEENAFDDLSKLEYLDLRYNQIDEIVRLGQIKVLKTLDLSFNSISEIPNRGFSSLVALENLFLSENGILQLMPNALLGLNSMKLLNLSTNSIQGIPTGFFASTRRLEVIDLSSNEISSLQASVFVELQNLRHLDLSKNSLVHLDRDSFAGMANLKFLILSKNDLVTIPSGLFSTLFAIEFLDLSENSLQVFNGNSIFGLPNTALRRIDLRQNKLRIIEDDSFRQLPSLDFLAMSHNNITRLSESLLSSNFRMKKLHFQHNQITLLTPYFIASIVNVTELLVDHNLLTSLPENVGSLKELKKISFEGNPLQCSCLDEIFRLVDAQHIDYYRIMTNNHFKGAKPICVVTSRTECLRDPDAVLRERVAETYQRG